MYICRKPGNFRSDQLFNSQLQQLVTSWYFNRQTLLNLQATMLDWTNQMHSTHAHTHAHSVLRNGFPHMMKHTLAETNNKHYKHNKWNDLNKQTSYRAQRIQINCSNVTVMINKQTKKCLRTKWRDYEHNGSCTISVLWCMNAQRMTSIRQKDVI